MTEVLNLNINGSITCHAWNKDKTQIALSPNSKEVIIYSKTGGNWHQIQVLTEHTSKVLSIDWAPQTNRIVSCGADKNAYVWSLDETQQLWKPELVVLRINRAATCVKWSPNEKKFAVGCGHRCICVCYFEPTQSFWVAKHLKKQIRSTTLCLDWHPNNALIAAAGTDFKCRLFCAYIKDVDGQAPQASPWGSLSTPADCIAEYAASNHGWVYSCAFNLTGDVLGFVAHDSTVYMVDSSRNAKEVISLRTPFLPFLSLKFISDKTAVAAGHDCYPVVFSLNGNTISLVEKLEVSGNKESAGKTNAMTIFKGLDRSRQDQPEQSSTNTIHQNSIKEISSFKQEGNRVSKLVTCGLDGAVVLWDLNTLSTQFTNLRIK